MKKRHITLAATAALGLSLALTPVAAMASTPAAPVASSATTAAKTLANPIDQTSYDQQLTIWGEVTTHGSADFRMTLKKAAPGATVTVTVNGVKSTAVANKNGVAKVDVTFLPKVNEVSVQQTKGAQKSKVNSYQYDFRA